ncbi:MAG: hypothetical protein HY554_15580 [Elusimicrobia bacterium]|nr:hypothetical protein [Elusimicrobiota bacterium]
MRKPASWIAALALIAAPVRAQEPRPAAPFPYTNAGPFVTVPASIVSSPAYQAGYIVGAIACLPVSIAKDARNEGKVPHDRQASLVCGRTLGAILGWPVYAAAGLPFFILKGLFWDAPRALAGSKPASPAATP